MDSPERSRASSDGCAQRLVAGDGSVLFDILKEHGESLRRFLEHRYRGLLRDDDVHDALTTAFLHLWLARSQAAGIASLKNWLWTAANCAAANLARSPRAKARRLELPLPVDFAQLADRSLQDHSQSVPEAPARLAALHAALEQLSAAQRRILLHDAAFEESSASDRELAEELHLAPATIRTHRRRALKKLRSLLCGKAPFDAGSPAEISPERERERKREKERERERKRGSRSQPADWLIFPARFCASSPGAFERHQLFSGKNVPVPVIRAVNGYER